MFASQPAKINVLVAAWLSACLTPGFYGIVDATQSRAGVLPNNTTPTTSVTPRMNSPGIGRCTSTRRWGHVHLQQMGASFPGERGRGMLWDSLYSPLVSQGIGASRWQPEPWHTRPTVGLPGAWQVLLPPSTGSLWSGQKELLCALKLPGELDHLPGANPWLPL